MVPDSASPHPAEDRLSRPATDQVADHLHSAAIHLLRRVRDVDQQLGMSAARLSCLSYLVFAGPASVSELARNEQVTPANISQLVNGMVRDGLVERLEDPGDGRGTLVTATSNGIALMRQGRQARIELLSGMLAGLDASDLDTLDRAASLIESRIV